MTTKAPGAFRTIGEVSDLLATPAHVLRFWESRFPQIKPVKRAGGRRYYRPADVALLGGIKRLLHDDGMTIRGVQKLLRDHGVRHVCSLAPAMDGEDTPAMRDAPGSPTPDTIETDMNGQDVAGPTSDAQEVAAAPAAQAPSPPFDATAPRRLATQLRGLDTIDTAPAAALLERCAKLAARLRAARGAEAP